MTGCSPRPSAKPLDRARAHSAFVVNQFATPGLGSLMAGRWKAGLGQLLLAGTGFGLFTAWFLNVLLTYYSLMFSDAPVAEPNLRHELWKSGLLLFGAAWLWALITSLRLLREARANAHRALTQGEANPPVIGRQPPPS
jgi:hypothetical protein